MKETPWMYRKGNWFSSRTNELAYICLDRLRDFWAVEQAKAVKFTFGDKGDYLLEWWDDGYMLLNDEPVFLASDVHDLFLEKMSKRTSCFVTCWIK